MDRDLVGRRLTSLRVVISLLFFALLTRFWFLQVVSGKHFEELAQANRIRYVPGTPAPRGIIYDRHGVILAASEQSYNVCIIPDALRSRAATFQLLSGILDMAPADIAAELAKKTVRVYDPVVIAEEVPLDVVTKVEENRVRLPGVIIQVTPIRKYTHGSLASQLLGHVGLMTESESAEQGERHHLEPDTLVGKVGAEKNFDEYLLGVRGQDRIEVNAHGDIVRREASQKELPGASVVLTIDAKMQEAAEEGLRESGHPGALVAIDVHNGEILVLANWPNFDPNMFSTALKVSEWNALIKDPSHPLLNRAIAAAYPPGSTFKMVTASAALQTRAITPSTTFDCKGSMMIGKRRFRCHLARGHGRLDLYGGIAQSCDVYFYQVGLLLGADRLAAFARQFGLGKETGIDIPGERAGNVPTTRWMRERYHQPWYQGDTANFAIGQGYLLCTPVQMAMVTAAVANDGELYQPHVLRKVVSAEGKLVAFPRAKPRNVGVDAKYLEVVKAGMRRAVTAGTSRSVVVPGIDIAAKTGTAQATGSPHAWFVCFAPYENPQIAIACVVEHAGHGSTAAGPVAVKVMQAYFSNDEPKPGKQPPTDAAGGTTSHP